MTLKPGCRFVVPPGFHVAGEWADRLLIGSGAKETDGSFLPHDSWRAPTAEELSMLVGSSAEQASPDGPQRYIELIQLPEHIGAEWWKMLDHVAEALRGGRLPGFESFASHVNEFLTFKGMAPPDGARFNLIVSDPAQQPSHSGGLLRSPAFWGAVNLGDEETSVVLINLSSGQRAAELVRRFPDQPAAAVDQLAAQFLRSFPDYPLVRLIVGPGQGFRIPESGMILGRDLQNKREPDVMLLISRESDRST